MNFRTFQVNPQVVCVYEIEFPCYEAGMVKLMNRNSGKFLIFTIVELVHKLVRDLRTFKIPKLAIMY